MEFVFTKMEIRVHQSMMKSSKISSIFFVVQCLLLTFVEPSSVPYTKKSICHDTASTLVNVARCPSDEQEFLQNSLKKKCYLEPPCQGEPLVFHCVKHKNSFAEVCAPRSTIKGRCCAEFDEGVGRVREDFSRLCLKCPFKYFSNDSALQPECSTPTTESNMEETMIAKTNSKGALKLPCSEDGQHISGRNKRSACNDDEKTTTVPNASNATEPFTNDNQRTEKSRNGMQLQEPVIYFVITGSLLIMIFGLGIFYLLRKPWQKKLIKKDHRHESDDAYADFSKELLRNNKEIC